MGGVCLDIIISFCSIIRNFSVCTKLTSPVEQNREIILAVHLTHTWTQQYEEIRGAHFEYQNRLRLSGMHQAPRVTSSPKWNKIPFYCIQFTDASTHTIARRAKICQKTPFQRSQGATEHRTNPMVSLSSHADDSTHRSLIFIKSRFKINFFWPSSFCLQYTILGSGICVGFYISCGSVESGVFCFHSRRFNRFVYYN